MIRLVLRSVASSRPLRPLHLHPALPGVAGAGRVVGLAGVDGAVGGQAHVVGDDAALVDVGVVDRPQVVELLRFAVIGEKPSLVPSAGAAGGVRVEMQEAGGKPIGGRALADCPEVFGDEIERVVSRKSGAEVSAQQGKPIRLRFALKDADLYSLRFRA